MNFVQIFCPETQVISAEFILNSPLVIFTSTASIIMVQSMRIHRKRTLLRRTEANKWVSLTGRSMV
jgi:hypothetical protein